MLKKWKTHQIFWFIIIIIVSNGIGIKEGTTTIQSIRSVQTKQLKNIGKSKKKLKRKRLLKLSMDGSPPDGGMCGRGWQIADWDAQLGAGQINGRMERQRLDEWMISRRICRLPDNIIIVFFFFVFRVQFCFCFSFCFGLLVSRLKSFAVSTIDTSTCIV